MGMKKKKKKKKEKKEEEKEEVLWAFDCCSLFYRDECVCVPK
ncbi:hypothetical protein TIFTF001_019741 [Ficus carica]|uniref:Uncharacterized protein n=1 Tax=Ficus carica TaxID=3494 RepID=A0AA88AGX5_FICCA|nr:hypothetical protein TIFTF001_019741 [Ficus carica]